MAQIAINKDFSKIRKKVAFGLTRRQLICFGVAGILGFAFYLSVHKTLGTTLSLGAMILLILPVFFICQYERDGRYLEDILKDLIETKVKRPGVRTYETDNVYAWLQNRIYLEEVLGIGTGLEEKNNIHRTYKNRTGKKRTGRS
jgi:hypothetical protein